MANRNLIDTSAPHEVVVLVGPDGKLKHVPCSPTISHHQLIRFKNDDGQVEYAVEPGYLRKGWSLLKDLYLAEKNPRGWASYEDWRAAATKTAKPRNFPDAQLPKEVRRRREEPADDIVEAADDAEVAAKPTAKGKAGG